MRLLFSIEGNIGSGKSTILHILKNTFKNIGEYTVVYLPEPIHVWNTIKDSSGVTILEKYYADQHRYAFSFQMMAYITRLSQLREALVKDNIIVITERCLFTDYHIFAKMLYDDGKIEEIEYSIYLKWFNEFISDQPVTNYIYIKTDPNICIERIFKRDRKGEDSIPLSYLANCHKYHEDWLNKEENILILDGNQPSEKYVTKIIDHITYVTPLIHFV